MFRVQPIGVVVIVFAVGVVVVVVVVVIVLVFVRHAYFPVAAMARSQ